MKRQILLILLLLSLTAGWSLTGCQPAALPAQFEVSSLKIKPSQIYKGETATVTAVVTNTGGSSGIYTATLQIDTVNSNSKSVHITPGEQETVTFSVKMNMEGKYNIEIGDTSATLTVNPKLVSQPMEIKYDDGFAQDYLALEKPATGFLVAFTPPSSQFIIDVIHIMGLTYGGRGAQIKDLEVQIWDKNRKVVYTEILDGKKFPQISYLSSNIEDKGDWVDMEIPDIKVEGDFFVHIYSGTSIGQGFRMGVDNSVANTHSDMTTRNANGADTPVTTWPYPSFKWFGDKGWVNWMISVSGSALVPEK